ncbi:J domain-containing protein [Methylacidimicrobium cyclopophantes]|uniref:J domain-containing protein n=1 Tax=Methylacidimicrobium cyclopophantes TaxID=1041766 RepID=UPI00115AA3EE|nr:J domain-containing protein [Methylacidimicrobium cyclopophantes]
MLVEEQSIRRNWEERYRRIQQRLGRAQERIHRFLSRERERFHVWTEKHFPELTREIAREGGYLHELRWLVFEVESMSWLKGQGPALAYRKVLEKRRSQRPAQEPESREAKKDPPDERLGSGLCDGGAIAEKKRRLKKAYRILARRLHPDVNGNGDTRRMEQWRAVQLAYQTGDLELLESFCLGNDSTPGEKEPLSCLAERVGRAEKTLLRSLQELRNYRKDPAWGCGRKGWETTVGPKVEAWLRARLAEMRKEARALKGRVRQWQRESERMVRAEQERERDKQPDAD